VLHGGPGVDELATSIAADAPSWTRRDPLTFTYDKGADTEGETADLKPTPRRFRGWLETLRKNGDATALAFAAAFAAERGRDGKGMVKPTALHFTAGQQQFLSSVLEIAGGLTPADVTEALLGPWSYQRKVKTLSWDSSTGRSYALRFGNPAKEQRLGNPGADWLAFQALPLLPVAGRGSSTLTACCGGGWKTGRFRWPLWDRPATLDTVRSLLVQPALEVWSPSERKLRGVVAVFASEIGRTEQGGYGSFGPSRLATKADRVGK